MSWEDQGRQDHGYFGHGTSGATKQLRGGATYYNLVGSRMKNGAMFDPTAMNAAMRDVPMGTKVHVTALDDPSRSIDVTVTDKGPTPLSNVIDLTPTAFKKLFGSLNRGRGQVIVTVPSTSNTR